MLLSKIKSVTTHFNKYFFHGVLFNPSAVFDVSGPELIVIRIIVLVQLYWTVTWAGDSLSVINSNLKSWFF